MRIAIYKRTGACAYEVIVDCGKVDNPDFRETDNDYIRLTEYIEVEFIPLPREDTVPQELAALNKKKKEAHAQYMQATAYIDEQISKLQAITHEVAK